MAQVFSAPAAYDDESEPPKKKRRVVGGGSCKTDADAEGIVGPAPAVVKEEELQRVDNAPHLTASSTATVEQGQMDAEVKLHQSEQMLYTDAAQLRSLAR